MYLSVSGIVSLFFTILGGEAYFQVEETAGYHNGVSFAAREYWMQRAIDEMVKASGPCPMNAYGTVIVNHTSTNPDGDLVCVGANSVGPRGDPTQHGEINAIQTCASQFLESNIRSDAALEAFQQLSLYTTAESCPMCASAIRWAGFKEYIYGTSIDQLIEYGIGQIDVSSRYIMQQARKVSGPDPYILGPIFTEKTNPYFRWINSDVQCPNGCHRSNNSCIADYKIN